MESSGQLQGSGFDSIENNGDLLTITPKSVKMGGIRLRGDTLVVEREPNNLGHLAIQFSSVLDSINIDHVFVSGYLAILTGRSRATEDIDVLLEKTTSEKISQLVARLQDNGFWGPAMPLEEMETMLNDNIWIARENEMVPHLEVKFADDEYDRASLTNKIEAKMKRAEATLPIGPLELQIAYILFLGTTKDFEDATHLYYLFEENLSIPELQRWISKLDVEEEYERLKSA